MRFGAVGKVAKEVAYLHVVLIANTLIMFENGCFRDLLVLS